MGGREEEGRLIEPSGPKFPSRFEPCLSRVNAGGVAILTFTSFVMIGEKGDRPTEQSHSWFPSGQLKLNSFIR